MLLNLLHRTLGVQRVDEDLVVVKSGLMRNGLAGVFG